MVATMLPLVLAAALPLVGSQLPGLLYPTPLRCPVSEGGFQELYAVAVLLA